MNLDNNTPVLEQAKALVDRNLDDTANMANICALVMTIFNHHWVGFYRVQNNRLELGPFQGPVACTTIEKGKGVCGAAWEQEKTIIVDDVHQFPGHIACSPFSNSEIVVPCIRNNEVFAVFDIDSENFAAFTDDDRTLFESIVALL